MSINERLKELRKILNMTQNEFGKLIGITGSTISDIEKGKSGLTDRNISMICEKFSVNEIWLRTGIGERLIESVSPEEKITALAARLSKTDKESFLKSLLEAISELDEDQINHLEIAGKAILANLTKKEESI